jgi:hypothetical protein
MHSHLKAMAGIFLATAVSGQAQTTTSTTTVHHARKAAMHKKHVRVNSVASQLEQLRQNMAQQQSQITSLQQQLADRTTQLQQVQQQSQQAVQMAQQEEQNAVQAAQASNQQNATAVAALQGSVNDLQTKHDTLVQTVKADQAKTTAAIMHPDAVHFKGITVSPTGSFIEFATVNRNRATASDIPTPFSSIPFTAADAGQLSEFYATGRQSRLALLASGNVGAARLSAYYEMDWLGTGVTSNNNQSNSYVLRERQLWAQAAFRNGFTVTGGQMWTLATENAHAMDNRTEVLPGTIDPNYQVGFVWARQPGLRVTYTMSPMITLGISAEQAQTLTPSCTASTGGYCPVNYLEGAPGTGGGLYNGGGTPGVSSSGALTTYAYNLAPDLLAKISLDPKFAHIELFGIERAFRNRIYPNENPQTGKVINAALASGAGAYNDSQIGGGVGGSARFFADQKRFAFGVKGMWGDGTSRYGTTQLPDLTLRPDGQFALLHNFSTMGFVDANVTPRLAMYAYYGTDYDFRTVFKDGTGTGEEGYGSHLLAESGCGTELAAGTTTSGAASSGAVNGFSPTTPGSCAVNTKDVQEGTIGLWYDFYKGNVGRFREGLQYSYVERNTYSGIGTITPTATDNVFETSMRYYLP